MSDSRFPHRKKRMVRDMVSTSLGWEMAIPIIGGALLGYKLDQLLNTAPLLTIGLLLLGIGFGYYSLYKVIELELLRLKQKKQSDESSQ